MRRECVQSLKATWKWLGDPTQEKFFLRQEIWTMTKWQCLCPYLQEHAVWNALKECVVSEKLVWFWSCLFRVRQAVLFVVTVSQSKTYTSVPSPRMSHVTTASMIVTRLDVCDELCAQSYPKTTKIRFFFHLLMLPVKNFPLCKTVNSSKKNPLALLGACVAVGTDKSNDLDHFAP